MKLTDPDKPQPIYKGEDGFLYVYDPESGKLWSLTSAVYAGEPGKPLPGHVKGIGKLDMLGMFRLSY
jgi:hypothetical protein